jgi:hypothetical protein
MQNLLIAPTRPSWRLSVRRASSIPLPNLIDDMESPYPHPASHIPIRHLHIPYQGIRLTAGNTTIPPKG